MKRFINTASLSCSLITIGAGLTHAQDENTDHLDAIGNGSATNDQWALAMDNLADSEMRPQVMELIKKRKRFPKQKLVNLLSHGKLSARLGAIELLEDATGGNNNFNPWLDPKTTDNEAAIDLWQAWVNNSADNIEDTSTKLNPEQIQTYIQQLTSDDRDRINRATRMLERDNFNAVAAIQQFIVDNPTLVQAKVNQLKQAQYELVLIKTSPTNAKMLSRDLTKGNRDQKLIALAAMKKLGMITIPIIRDFVDDADPLTRETAVDAFLSIGGAQNLNFIIEQLEKETDINVIHVAIKNLKNIRGDKSKEIVKAYLNHEDEDLVITAISAMTNLLGGSSSYGGFSSSSSSNKTVTDENSKAITQLLDDNRWRVRVAALEHVTKLKLKDAAPQIIKLLENDSDEFVRHHSIKTAVALKLTEAKPLIGKLYKTNDEMIPSLTTALIGLDGKLSKEMLDYLKTRDADTIISSLDAFTGSKPEILNSLITFVKYDNIDISCAALRLLSNDNDKTKQSFVANTLTDALKTGNKDKISAILNSLELPTNDRTSSELRYLKQTAVSTATVARSTKLDPLYNAFLLPGGKPVLPDNADSSSQAESTGGVRNLINTITKLAKEEPGSEQSFQIAMILTKSGEAQGLEILEDSVAEMSISKRSALAEALYNPRQVKSVPAILALLQDPSKEIRTKAIAAAFRNTSNKVLMQAALNTLTKKDTKITGADAYNYSTENASKNTTSRPLFKQWALTQLSESKVEQQDDRITILSLILLRNIARSSDAELIAPLTKHKNTWVRRAAWHSLGFSKSTWYNENLDKLITDQHPNVRAALCDPHTRADTNWSHTFSDTDSRSNQSYYSNVRSRRLSKEVEQALREMVKSDSSAENRFEAMLTLLSHSREIDLQKFINLIPKQTKEVKVTSRLSELVQDNYSRMGKGLRPLLAYVDYKLISTSYHSKIAAHFGTDSSGKGEAGFGSFSALAKTSDISAAPQHLSTPEENQAAAADREKLVIVFFEKTGCKKCLEVETFLADLQQDFPLMEIEHSFVDKPEGILLNTHLSGILQVPATQMSKAPAIFTSQGFLVGGNITPQSLAKLFSNTMEVPEKKDWHVLEGDENIQLAQQGVDKIYNDLTLPIVIAGGLLDGINPCAFATIIFFLSYLTIAKRSPKEIFFVGITFILAVFLSYLSFGLLFSKALEWLTANENYQWIRGALNYIFAGFALLVAFLSLRDWWRARQGRLEDMTLQLPNFLKKKIRSVIRENSKSRLYVFAAFGTGVAISVLELACTGQVYAPIIYKINQGNQDAVTMLVIYNLAFVLPLIVIFGFAMSGMRSNALINFQKNHTSKVKLLTAILFFILAAVLLFSTQITVWLESFYPAINN